MMPMLTRTGRAIVICLMIGGGTPAFSADEFKELGLKALVDISKALAPHASSLRLALDKLNENIELSIPKSMMDEATLKQLEDDTLQLNRVVPQPLASINNKGSIERIARGRKHKGTLIGASEELQRLERAGRARAAEIEKYVRVRGNIELLRTKYQETEQIARTLSDKIGKLATDPSIEFFGRLTGRSVGLSWVDFETDFLDALGKRREAAERAVGRLDAVIDRAERDVRNFNESRLFANAIFAEHVGSATGLDASAVPGTAVAKLEEIGRNMEADTKATMELSNKMRDEASEIRQWNAGISKFQAMLNWISLGLSGRSGEINADAETEKISPKTKSVFLMRDGDNWYYRKVITDPKKINSGQ